MPPLTRDEYLKSLKRRRIKFVVEKGSMAKLFKAGTGSDLQIEIYKKIALKELFSIRSIEEYDQWLINVIEDNCWSVYSRNGLDIDRWAYFAKLINIIIYEIVLNRELADDKTAKTLYPFLHLPIDSSVTYSLEKIDPKFPGIWFLKGMSKESYMEFQHAARKLGRKYNIPPIWFEAAYSS